MTNRNETEIFDDYEYLPHVPDITGIYFESDCESFLFEDDFPAQTYAEVLTYWCMTNI